MIDNEPEGATPIDADEQADLQPEHIHTRSELNLWEQENILEAVRWAERTRKDALDESFVRELHRRMFDKTWKWAGKYRRSEKNIGVDWIEIAAEVRNLVDDGRFWFKNDTFPTDVAALRLHHRLVKIHPFVNGNGRHGRLWCDCILRQFGRAPFVWKNAELDRSGSARLTYIQALRDADDNDYGRLMGLLLTNRG